ncbi:TetR/AcrR family transcriptional regulator [Thermaurantiacus tibetensis]|uniref:TetR/AcrR family transcriptional regulator n=1 Tax=Thermaurantiacus tibetensis TaxID=2759035 RepID=UPI001890000A|nr:TetR/AcrR family transcriptional regulator [Thermaurantiacus tibetensis]
MHVSEPGPVALREDPQPAGRPDGRRLRSLSSRNRIVAALVALVEEGNLAPTAETVADRAGLSLRTVFRHFEDMDRLYLEIAGVILDRAQTFIDKPFAASGWPEILPEIVARRAEFYEAVAPFKRALDIYRNRSAALDAAGAEIALMSRNVFLARVPEDARPDPASLEAMVLLISIESWLQLRKVHGLDIAAAQAAVLAGVRALAANGRSGLMAAS